MAADTDIVLDIDEVGTPATAPKNLGGLRTDIRAAPSEDMLLPFRWWHPDSNESRIAVKYEVGTPDWPDLIRRLVKERSGDYVVVFAPTTREDATEEVRRARYETMAAGAMWRYPNSDPPDYEREISDMNNRMRDLEEYMGRLPVRPPRP